MHAVELAHDTPVRLLTRLPGLGLGVVDHAKPFHSSIKVCVDPRTSPHSPTTTQYDVVTHDTPLSTLSGLPAFGLGAMAHMLPFHTSTSVWLVGIEFPCPGPELPTATQ